MSPAPEVRLVKQFEGAFKNFLATARTCYSSKGIIEDEAIDDSWDWLAKSLYKAGHHTTLQHSHFQFTLDKVSRHFLWSFLHSHPFYNSEQVSQRYVTVKPGNITVPPLNDEAHAIYMQTVTLQMERYEQLCKSLFPLVSHHYTNRFPARALEQKKHRMDIKRKAQEVARYVLPVATHAYLYHTISGVTLLRYHRLCQMYDTPLEQRMVVDAMIQQVLKEEPRFASILEAPIELEGTPEHRLFESNRNGHQPAAEFLQEFDESLDGYVSRLVGRKENNETLLADSVREVLGVPRSLMNDEQAIARAISPAENQLLGESLNLTTLSKISRCLFHPSYTFRKKISHTADSQDQRHRMTPASRPILAGHLTEQPDYITPALITEDEAIHDLYRDTMNKTWDAITRMKNLGASEEAVQYLLPNAVSIRFTESSDLLNLHHKLAMRLCYNAQEEIWQASVDEAKQIRDVEPHIGKYLLPPCTLRHLSKSRPICPEGDRFCGERVWTYDIENYERVI